MPDVEIVDVQFSPPWLDEPDFERGERRAWTDVIISVRNRASRTTYYVWSDTPAFQYEESSATLKLLFLEPPPTEEMQVTSRRRLPQFMPVLPGTTVAIRESFPIEMKVLEFDTDGVLNVQKIDISQVQRVEVTIAHDMTPFRSLGADNPIKIRNQLHDWGSNVDHACECCIPTKRSNDEPSIESK